MTLNCRQKCVQKPDAKQNHNMDRKLRKQNSKEPELQKSEIRKSQKLRTSVDFSWLSGLLRSSSVHFKRVTESQLAQFMTVYDDSTVVGGPYESSQIGITHDYTMNPFFGMLRSLLRWSIFRPSFARTDADSKATQASRLSLRLRSIKSVKSVNCSRKGFA